MYTVTITSKNQITIPSAIVKKYNLKKGQQLIAGTDDKGNLTLSPAVELIKSLKGSVSTNGKKPPTKAQLQEAKDNYFKKHFT